MLRRIYPSASAWPVVLAVTLGVAVCIYVMAVVLTGRHKPSPVIPEARLASESRRKYRQSTGSLAPKLRALVAGAVAGGVVAAVTLGLARLYQILWDISF